MELDAGRPPRLPPPRLPALAPDRAQPGAHAEARDPRDPDARDERSRSGSRTTTRRSQRLDAARAAHNTWYEREFGGLGGKSIAYFSAEFALHQSLPIYAGGLGVLAGDHCKEASDLGVPLVGVGFMYPQGYFHQSVSADGWQEEIYEKLNWTGHGDRAGDDA